jgi:hypothetical protein
MAAFGGFFELKALLASPHAKDRRAFQKQFTTYYKLGSAGLTEAFKFGISNSCSPALRSDRTTRTRLSFS